MQDRLADNAARSARSLAEMQERMNETLHGNSKQTTTSLTQLQERLASIDKAQDNITKLSGDVLSLQDILSNKQTRGSFGEIQLHDIVSKALPANAYTLQSTLSNGKRPDCLIHLPNPPGPIVIDSKFPLEAYEALHEILVSSEKAAKRSGRLHNFDFEEVSEDSAIISSIITHCWITRASTSGIQCRAVRQNITPNHRSGKDRTAGAATCAGPCFQSGKLLVVPIQHLWRQALLPLRALRSAAHPARGPDRRNQDFPCLTISADPLLGRLSEVLRDRRGVAVGIVQLCSFSTLRSRLRHRVGKGRCCCCSFCLPPGPRRFGASVRFSLAPEISCLFALICVASGAVLGADLTLLPAMFATRMARIAPSAAEGFGLWAFVSKFTLAFAAVALLPTLQGAGLQTGSITSPPEAVRLLVLLYAGVPCALKLIAIALMSSINEMEVN
ncbi:hypothetical protein GQR58_030563 [Nymphon striatum]|nr:hypothetical protein GQR58_030563 [Nymphon striatum]